MTDLDPIARHHAEVLHASVTDAERPELMTRKRTIGSRRGLLVAAIAAVIAVVVIAPLAWRPTPTPPSDTVSTITTVASESATTSTIASSPTTSGVASLSVFDAERFVGAMLGGVFGDDEDRIGMVVLAPAGTDLTGLLDELPELEEYKQIQPEVVAEAAIAYADRRRMAPLEGSWRAYGIIPQYSGTPVWDWEPALRTIADAVFASNLNFERPEIRIPDGWSLLAEMDSVVLSGSINAVTDSGLVLINSTATTIVGPDGFVRDGGPSPVTIPDSCCGGAVGYSYGDGVLLLEGGRGAWLLDLATVSWREIDPLPAVANPVGADIYPLGMATLNNELFVVIVARVSASPTSEVVALDLETGQWRELEPVPSPFTRGGVTTDGTRLIVSGVYQDNNNAIIGGRSPAVYEYTEAEGWSGLPSIPIDGQASTITWIDNIGLLAWNYDLESALSDEGGTWQDLGDVPMDFSECLPTAVANGSGAAGACGGLAWFDGALGNWNPIDVPRNGHLLLSEDSAFSVVTAASKTTVLQYSLPPAN